jgi:N,N'-diacetyllegionaminate synthase
MRVFVIAEAANTWRIGRVDDQHLRYARKAIVTAKAAGADAVKFQWTSDPQLMAERRKVLPDTYSILAWPAAWLPLLAKECERVDIEFMCSCFLAKDVATIAPYVQRFKIASLEAQDTELRTAMLGHGKPVIVSTGAHTWEAFGWAFQYDEEVVQFLQCTCAYPAPLSTVNLQGMKNWYANEGNRFGNTQERIAFHMIGLSDHTGDTLTGAVAVGAGAQIIECHFRLDETLKNNPDYNHSHSPNSFVEYVMNIRKAEVMMGDGIKKVEECERPLLKHRVNT